MHCIALQWPLTLSLSVKESLASDVALSTEVDGLNLVAQLTKLVFALRPVLSVVHPGAPQRPASANPSV